MNITEKLNEARLEVTVAQAAHSIAALDAEESGTAATKATLAKAAAAVTTARQRVVDLQAALVAETARDEAVAAEQAADAVKAEQLEVHNAVGMLLAAGQRWDTALDSLVEVTHDMLRHEQLLSQVRHGQGGMLSLDRARMFAMDAINWKLRFWVGQHVPAFSEELATITTHLPQQSQSPIR
jgi:hypothetical protein